MSDLWGWLTVGGAVGVGAAARELGGFALRGLRARAATRKADAEIAREIRDELRTENQTLRAEVRVLRDEVRGMVGKLQACEDRSAHLEREMARRVAYAEERERRISQLEDKVGRLEARTT